uniref:Protein LURP-one-related 8 n=1 Tax=Kalanchoe fedtschenkoi TaxID=63787 RepID=A0A7N0RAT2_KALFE
MPKLLGVAKKVHPNAAAATGPVSDASSSSYSSAHRDTQTSVKSTVLTVWKKSLLMNCSGFTVFDALGNLLYRVDNYLAGSKSEILLMDASGNPLFTVRRKRLTLGDNWLVYDGETTVKPRFSATKKSVNFRNAKCLAQVSAGSTSEDGSSKQSSPSFKNTVYEVEGSYGQRSCVIYDRDRRHVAEIKRKEAAVGGADFGTDVFRLVVQPEMDSSVAMAVVILLDQMFEASSRRCSP